jgi:hypothetical protein
MLQSHENRVNQGFRFVAKYKKPGESFTNEYFAANLVLGAVPLSRFTETRLEPW